VAVAAPPIPDRGVTVPPVGVCPDHKQALLARLRRIEGQVRGLHRMVEEDASCVDVLTQISAATHALDAVGLNLLEDHLRHCVSDAIAGGGPDAQTKLAEATGAIRRMLRS